jgi:FkbM family methyltransferase
LRAHKAAPYWSLGNTDSSYIAHHLAAYYDADAAEHSPGVIFDIGANRGNTVQELISALIPAFACYRYYTLAAVAGAECRRWFGSLIAVEANPPTADGLAARAAFERWDLLDFVLVREAFTDVAGGVAHFAVREAGEETASLNDASSAGAGANGTVAVPLGTVDALRAARGETSRRIFLLKIDAEGFDAKVIKGAETALREGHVKFLVAEYNSLWASSKAAGAPPDAPPAWTLRSCTEYLWGLDYECWLLSTQHFMPLWGEWWDDSYEFWTHSNFVCARKCDADMRRLVEAARNVSLSGAPPSGFGCGGPAAKGRS